MSQGWSLFRAELKSHHLFPGRTSHSWADSSGSRPFPPFIAVEIVRYGSEEDVYLMHIAEDGSIADTWHPTVEEAMNQATFEFNVTPEEWIKMERPFGN